MAQQPLLARIIGIPHIPSVTEVNIRPIPGTNQDLKFKVPVGMSNLTVIDVQPDVEGKNLNGKVYQWFRINFPQGDGWVRDDLIEVWGDGTTVGYPIITTPIVAFNLTRRIPSVAPGQEVAAPATTPAQPATTVATTPAQPAATTTTPVQPAAPAQPAASTPAQPAAPAQPVVVTTVTTPTTPVSAPMGPAVAIAMGQSGVNMRPGPGTGNNPTVARMNYRDTAEILDIAPGDDGVPLNWVKLAYQGKTGWVREDFLRLTGDFKTFALNAKDKYPSPAPDSWWVRGWDPQSTVYKTGPHHGWDHGGNKGAKIIAGPAGGVVYDVVFCNLCGTQGASTVEKGFSLGDSRIFREPGWNFGYGHYIVVGYENSTLPASTQAELANRGFAGGHIFVMYAHLQDMLVKKGDRVQAGQQIGTLGNSGNSSGAHLHLEIRASTTMAPARWAAINNGLMDPGVLFLK